MNASAFAWLVAQTDMGELPVVIVNSYGAGKVVFLSVHDPEPLMSWNLLPFTVHQLADDVMPIVVTYAGSAKDARSRVQVSVNRSPTGFVVGLINNLGVDKYYTTDQVIHPDSAVAVEVALKDGVGTLTGAHISSRGGLRCPEASVSGKVQVTVGAGDVEVLELHVAEGSFLI